MKYVFRQIYGPWGTIFSFFLFLSVIYLPEVFGRLEGRYFPIISHVSIQVVDSTNSASTIKGAMFIRRPECKFDHIEWDLVTPVRTATVDVKFLAGTKARPGGWNTFGPWAVSIRPDQLESSTIAKVFHKCPWSPWLVESHFYPEVVLDDSTP